MADLTQEHTLTTDWADITTALGLVSGKSYAVDVSGARSAAVALWAETDTTTPAPTVHGHPLTPRQKGGVVDNRIHGQLDNVYLWMRIDRGEALVSVTPSD